MSRAPIWIRCEGSGCPYNINHAGVPSCQMCGAPVFVDEPGVVAPHQRQDILAMIDRGDFAP